MLIKDIATLKSMIPSIISAKFEKYSQALMDAEVWFAMNIAGRALFAEVLGSPDDDPLLEKSKLIIAYRAYASVVPKLDVRETDNGFAVVNDSSLVPASKDRVQALVKSVTDSLDAAVFDLFEYLEDTPEFAVLWRQSPSCTILSGSLLPTLRRFRRYGVFDGTYYDWRNQASRHRSEIIRMIHPVISKELTDELIAQLSDGSVTPANDLILDDICFALAGYCTDKSGEARDFVCNARSTIDANPDDYPAFTSSKLYLSITNRPQPSQSNSVGVFGL